MGFRKPENWKPEDWRATAETVGAMRKAHWDIIAHCLSCHLTLRVDTAVIIQLRGPNVSLWNKQAPCKKVGCKGSMEFQGRPPQLSRHFALRAEWPIHAAQKPGSHQIGDLIGAKTDLEVRCVCCGRGPEYTRPADAVETHGRQTTFRELSLRLRRACKHPGCSVDARARGPAQSLGSLSPYGPG
jgi:hypothetical protein